MPTNPIPADQLAAFLCRHHLRQILGNPHRTTPLREETFGIILLLDLSGFSELTEQYAQRGAEGAEQLSLLLDQYFGEITRRISAAGGDILGFAGDAVLALWSVPARDVLTSPALRAVETAINLQRELGQLPSVAVKLTQRIGIGSGSLDLLQIGGHSGNWTFLAAGDPIRDAGQANQQAGPGEVVVSLDVWRLIESSASGVPLSSGAVRLTGVTAPKLSSSDEPDTSAEIAAAALSRFVPRIVSERLAVGQAAWLGEFRTLTVLFVQLLGVETRSSGGFERLNRAIEIAQQQLARFEGSLYQFLMDDKGLVLLAVFGFPPLAHEDEAARGLRAAVAIRTGLAGIQLASSIGVATGRAFCGVYGADFRRQYSAVGPVMNIAARLMQAASGGILADETTQRAAAAQGIAFDVPRRLRLKGISPPLAVYSPASGRATIVDRVEEQAALEGALQRLIREHRSAVIVLEGEPGVGKSELIELLKKSAQAERIPCFSGTGEAIERLTPYHLWRGVFRSLFRLDALPDDPVVHRRHVQEELAAQPEVAQLIPLLNAVLPMQIPESDLTAQMSGQVRAENTNRLLARLLQGSAQNAPELLTFDDVHCADSASWAVVGLVSQSVTPMLMVLSLRPLLPESPPEYQQLLRSPNTIHFHLRLLSQNETEELLCRRLSVESLPEAVAEFIHHKTGGQPLFAEQLTYALRDAGLIRIAGATCMLNLEPGQDLEHALERLQIPNTIEGVVTARMDRLDPSQQMVLKVASVIGFDFSLATLQDVYPLAAERKRLPAILNDLERLDLIHRIASGTDAYEFNHRITCDVVYSGVAFSKRRELHRAVAEWYEQSHPENRESLAPILAHHWAQAEQLGPASAYAAQAGELALHNFANEEAIRFLKSALELDSKDANPGNAEKQTSRRLQGARWEILLGRACVNLGRHNDGREHLARGLASYGERMPTSNTGLVLGLAGEVVRQLTYRLRGGRIPASAEPTTALRECAGAYEGLVEIFYLQNQSLGSLYCALKSLNLAEKAGPTPERARGYATLGALSGFIPLRSAAESYLRMALETAEQVQDLVALEWVLLSIGVYDVGVGNWDRASSGIRRALDVAERLGDSRRKDDFRQILACVLFHTGDIAGCLPLLDDAQKSAGRRGDARLQGEVVRWKAYALLLLGRYAELKDCLSELQRLRTLPTLTGEVFQLADVYTLRAASQLRQGQDAAALEAAQEAAGRLDHMQDAFHDLLLERLMVAQVFLQLWEKQAASLASSSRTSPLRDAARKACRRLTRFSRVFPIGLPYARVSTGRLEALSGRPARAEKEWASALAEAERLRLPFAEALACYQLGRHPSDNLGQRQAWLERARAVFARIGAPYELAAAENALLDVSEQSHPPSRQKPTLA